MTDKQYAEAIIKGHLLYWNMLGALRGIENHKEDGLRWLTGDVDYNYYCESADIDGIIQRMKNGKIPKNLTFITDNLETDPAEPFRAAGLFEGGSGTTGMAHELAERPIPKFDKRINLFRVHEISQLKTVGTILNSAFEYRLFSFEHYLEMFNNYGQFFYLAEYDGLPVGAVMSQYGDIFVNISWAGTLPGYRKLGIAGCLIQMAEQDALLHGKNISVLHSRPNALGAYRRIGYREYCRGIEIEFCG